MMGQKSKYWANNLNKLFSKVCIYTNTHICVYISVCIYTDVQQAHERTLNVYSKANQKKQYH